MSGSPPPAVLAPAAPGAMASRLHGERVLLAGWGRAILLQLAHPKVARGVAEHSGFLAERRGRLRRLHRTLGAMLTLTFGTPAEVERVARTIRGIHDGVHGRLLAAAGVFAADAPYSAHDPALLGWVHATLVESFLSTYELFVGPLGAGERDRYCEESAAIAPLLGIPPGQLPLSMAELTRYLQARLASGEIEVTDTARQLAREILFPPAPLIARPLLALARLPTVGLLPPVVRTGYGLAWDGRRERALGVLAASSRRLLPLLPSPLRHWRAARAAWSRARVGGASGGSLAAQ